MPKQIEKVQPIEQKTKKTTKSEAYFDLAKFEKTQEDLQQIKNLVDQLQSLNDSYEVKIVSKRKFNQELKKLNDQIDILSTGARELFKNVDLEENRELDKLSKKIQSGEAMKQLMQLATGNRIYRKEIYETAQEILRSEVKKTKEQTREMQEQDKKWAQATMKNVRSVKELILGKDKFDEDSYLKKTAESLEDVFEDLQAKHDQEVKKMQEKLETAAVREDDKEVEKIKTDIEMLTFAKEEMERMQKKSNQLLNLQTAEKIARTEGLSSVKDPVADVLDAEMKLIKGLSADAKKEVVEATKKLLQRQQIVPEKADKSQIYKAALEVLDDSSIYGDIRTTLRVWEKVDKLSDKRMEPEESAKLIPDVSKQTEVLLEKVEKNFPANIEIDRKMVKKFKTIDLYNYIKDNFYIDLAKMTQAQRDAVDILQNKNKVFRTMYREYNRRQIPIPDIKVEKVEGREQMLDKALEQLKPQIRQQYFLDILQEMEEDYSAKIKTAVSDLEYQELINKALNLATGLTNKEFKKEIKEGKKRENFYRKWQELIDQGKKVKSKIAKKEKPEPWSGEEITPTDKKVAKGEAYIQKQQEAETQYLEISAEMDKIEEKVYKLLEMSEKEINKAKKFPAGFSDFVESQDFKLYQKTIEAKNKKKIAKLLKDYDKKFAQLKKNKWQPETDQEIRQKPKTKDKVKKQETKKNFWKKIFG